MKIEKNKKYLIATDLDGTFLTSETQSMNIHNQLVVKKLQELGHHFVIATGRS
ncbi:MAG: hypothetical protein DRP42_01920 [Tenericutes bacterium]|nr:MAG: hypothetical protein DRP42_01920 [Mycoplasmatota bacterium]